MGDRKASPWLVGCGIGCGVVVLLLAGLIGGGALFVGRMTRGLHDADTARLALEERHGAPDRFIPQADGAIPAPRMEAFLKVREALAPHREALAGIFQRLPIDEIRHGEFEQKTTLEKLSAGFSIGREALALGPAIGDFFGAREKAMLDEGIGTGEYELIYTLAYYSWLGHPPSDGPGAVIRERSQGGQNEFRVMSPRVMSRVHRELVAIFRNQLAAQPAGANKSWSEKLAAEVAALEADDDRIPWQEGVPEAISASLAPYRERLEAAYNPVTNPFELARNRRRGRWTYHSE